MQTSPARLNPQPTVPLRAIAGGARGNMISDLRRMVDSQAALELGSPQLTAIPHTSRKVFALEAEHWLSRIHRQ